MPRHKIKPDSMQTRGSGKKRISTKTNKNIDVQERIKLGSVYPVACVAIMGQPNVGKSSLFNRILKEHIAITSPIRGSTRDINIRNVVLNGFAISLIDTGGLDNISNPKLLQTKEHIESTLLDSTKSSTNIHSLNLSNKNAQEKIAGYLKDIISINSHNALYHSDIILYMVDGSSIATSEDIRNFRILSKLKPTILVLNKVDSDKILLDPSEFLSFGTEYIAISVAHNRGITNLLTHIENTIKSHKLDSREIQTYTPPQAIKEDNTKHIFVGIIGRTNVGKSSLLNALTNKQRSLVSIIPGTTIDPIDESITYKDTTITFIDTAGIRHRSKILGIEKYALDRTKKILQQCHIAILVLDSGDDFVELDERISAIAHEYKLGIIVVLNKWDIKTSDFKSIMQIYKSKFRFLEYAPVLTISTTTKHHIEDLKEKIKEVYNNFTYRIPTSELNGCLQKAFSKHPIPSKHGKIVKIYYATQFDANPPKIALIMNRPDALHFSYKRYLINTLRARFNFSGVPLILEPRKKQSSKDAP